MTLNQLASLGPSALKTREGLSFLLGYAKHEGIDSVTEAIQADEVDCIILCDVYTRDVDALCAVLEIADIDFS
jgi:hypothetical protein